MSGKASAPCCRGYLFLKLPKLVQGAWEAIHEEAGHSAVVHRGQEQACAHIAGMPCASAVQPFAVNSLSRPAGGAHVFHPGLHMAFGLQLRLSCCEEEETVGFDASVEAVMGTRDETDALCEVCWKLAGGLSVLCRVLNNAAAPLYTSTPARAVHAACLFKHANSLPS